jgi:hypothetical protein
MLAAERHDNWRKSRTFPKRLETAKNGAGLKPKICDIARRDLVLAGRPEEPAGRDRNQAA